MLAEGVVRDELREGHGADLPHGVGVAVGVGDLPGDPAEPLGPLAGVLLGGALE